MFPNKYAVAKPAFIVNALDRRSHVRFTTLMVLVGHATACGRVRATKKQMAGEAAIDREAFAKAIDELIELKALYVVPVSGYNEADKRGLIPKQEIYQLTGIALSNGVLQSYIYTTQENIKTAWSRIIRELPSEWVEPQIEEFYRDSPRYMKSGERIETDRCRPTRHRFTEILPQMSGESTVDVGSADTIYYSKLNTESNKLIDQHYPLKTSGPSAICENLRGDYSYTCEGCKLLAEEIQREDRIYAEMVDREKIKRQPPSKSSGTSTGLDSVKRELEDRRRSVSRVTTAKPIETVALGGESSGTRILPGEEKMPEVGRLLIDAHNSAVARIIENKQHTNRPAKPLNWLTEKQIGMLTQPFEKDRRQYRSLDEMYKSHPDIVEGWIRERFGQRIEKQFKLGGSAMLTAAMQYHTKYYGLFAYMIDNGYDVEAIAIVGGKLSRTASRVNENADLISPTGKNYSELYRDGNYTTREKIQEMLQYRLLQYFDVEGLVAAHYRATGEDFGDLIGRSAAEVLKSWT